MFSSLQSKAWRYIINAAVATITPAVPETQECYKLETSWVNCSKDLRIQLLAQSVPSMSRPWDHRRRKEYVIKYNKCPFPKNCLLKIFILKKKKTVEASQAWQHLDQPGLQSSSRTDRLHRETLSQKLKIAGVP